MSSIIRRRNGDIDISFVADQALRPINTKGTPQLCLHVGGPKLPLGEAVSPTGSLASTSSQSFV
jgi:hypothetical protein